VIQVRRHSAEEAVERIFRKLLGSLVAVLTGSIAWHYLSKSPLGEADVDITIGLIVAVVIGRIMQRLGL